MKTKSYKLLCLNVILGLVVLSACSGDDKNSNSSNSTEDPLYQYQWHLKNDGISKIRGVSPQLAGADINLTTPDGGQLTAITGKGVKVAVVDTGLEIAHPDLKDRILQGSWDFVEGDNDPTSDSRDGDHGTSVAGIIAATGWNGVGGRGVAPSAGLKGFNFIETAQTLTEYVSSHGGGNGQQTSHSNDIDIFNLSYGSDTSNIFNPIPRDGGLNVLELVKQCFVAGFCNDGQALRNGKGAIYVKAAGNAFMGLKVSADEVCQFFVFNLAEINASCHNTNMEFDNTLPYNIVVGAITAQDIKSSYSSIGSSLWISAYGGESGYSKEVFLQNGFTQSEIDNVYYRFEPAIITTDQASCYSGIFLKTFYVEKLFPSYFDDPRTAPYFGNNCDYTSLFNGTSAATPIVSGVVALMLEANPSLTWRDVKHIVAKTATKIHSDIVAGEKNGIVHTPLWVENAAGYSFHNWYGFGKINAGAAVEMAQDYQEDLGVFKIFKSNNKAVNTDLTLSQHTFDLEINESIAVEAITADLNITAQNLGTIQIELVSPQNTTSVLMHAYNGLQYREGNNAVDSNATVDGVLPLTSNVFYGEDAKGNWQLKIIKAPEANGNNKLSNWQLTIYGH